MGCEKGRRNLIPSRQRYSKVRQCQYSTVLLQFCSQRSGPSTGGI